MQSIQIATKKPYNRFRSLLSIALLLIIIFFPYLMIQFPTKTHKSTIFPFNIPENCQKLLLYFGYLDCNLECPIALNLLKNYKKTQKISHCIFFINLYPNQLGAQSYAKAFDPSFNGITLSEKEIKQISDQLNLSLNRNLNQNVDSFYFDLINRKHPDYFYEWNQEDGIWHLVNRHAVEYFHPNALMK
jgi:hypothetical protein